MSHSTFPKKITARVIINEQHVLTQDQVRILETSFPDFELLPIPSRGLSRADLERLAGELLRSVEAVVFASPVPLLLAIMAGRCGRSLAARNDGEHPSGTPPVFLFHNDSRTKSETLDGRISAALSPDGWELLLL